MISAKNLHKGEFSTPVPFFRGIEVYLCTQLWSTTDNCPFVQLRIIFEFNYSPGDRRPPCIIQVQKRELHFRKFLKRLFWFQMAKKIFNRFSENVIYIGLVGLGRVDLVKDLR